MLKNCREINGNYNCHKFFTPPSQPVVVVRLFNNFKSISCCKIVWWRNKRRWRRAKWIIRGRKFRMKWILLPVRYHSLFICLLIVLFTLSLDPFNVYKKKECPSCDGSGSLTSSGQVDGKTERIKNECSMMRHKKVACKAFSITPTNSFILTWKKLKFLWLYDVTRRQFFFLL